MLFCEMSARGSACCCGVFVTMEVLVGMAVYAGDPVVGGVVWVGDLSEGEQAQKINMTPNNHREIREFWLMVFT